MTRIITIIMLFSGLSFQCFSQDSEIEKFVSSVVKTKNGATISFTNKEHSFSLTVLAAKITQQAPGFLAANSQILQYLTLPFPQKIDYNSLSEDLKEKNLLAYNTYEMDYIKRQLDRQNVGEKDEFLSLNNRTYLFWSYDMPVSYTNVLHQCYLITYCYDNMLVLNAPVEKNETIGNVKRFLIAIGQSLR